MSEQYELTAIARWLREMREETGWSQTDLSWECRIAPTMISNFERGKYQPNVRTLERLCAALQRGGAPAALPWVTVAKAKVGDKRRNHKVLVSTVAALALLVGL